LIYGFYQEEQTTKEELEDTKGVIRIGLSEEKTNKEELEETKEVIRIRISKKKDN
jgi:hypothetical protein